MTILPIKQVVSRKCEQHTHAQITTSALRGATTTTLCTSLVATLGFSVCTYAMIDFMLSPCCFNWFNILHHMRYVGAPTVARVTVSSVPVIPRRKVSVQRHRREDELDKSTTREDELDDCNVDSGGTGRDVDQVSQDHHNEHERMNSNPSHTQPTPRPSLAKRPSNRNLTGVAKIGSSFGVGSKVTVMGAAAGVDAAVGGTSCMGIVKYIGKTHVGDGDYVGVEALWVRMCSWFGCTL